MTQGTTSLRCSKKHKIYTHTHTSLDRVENWVKSMAFHPNISIN